MSDWRCHHCGHDFGEIGPDRVNRRCPQCGRLLPAFMTEGQLTDQLRNQRYVDREGLVSLMNATKWREAEAAINRIVGRWPWWRAATLRESSAMGQFDHDEYYFRAIPRECIETLDIDVKRTVGDPTASAVVEAVAASLRALGVPFTREDGFLRVWGYARPGQFPSFLEFARND